MTVAVPVFDGERTLGETLESIRQQVFRDFECFIVDDGSVDASPEIAKRICEADTRFALIRQANMGVAAARNIALAMARGRYFAALDADDIWHPDFLARHVEAMAAAPLGTGYTYSLARFIDADGQVIEAVPSHAISGQIERCLRYCNSCGNPSVVMFDREAALAVDGYDSRLRAAGCEGSEDWLLILKVASTRRAIGIPLYLSGYRRSAGSMSADRARMIASSELGESLHGTEAERDAVPRSIRRWQRSARQLEFAKSAGRQRRWLAFVRYALKALWLDPLRVLALAADIPLRAVIMPYLGNRTIFADLDPADRFASFETCHPFKSRVMERRLRRLAGK